MKGKKVLSITAKINGSELSLTVPSKYTLAELLRESLDLTGTKLGCNRAECGVCTVLLDGNPVFSCTVLAADANKREIMTIEGLASKGKLDKLQEAFVKEDALQCGFCTPGILMSLKSLLDRNSAPTVEEVRDSIAGNYCRCGAYPNMIEAVIKASAVRTQ
jgi:aerobic-type carbon monoxide dehydrogenase small subunit (CoxS/CutS family)